MRIFPGVLLSIMILISISIVPAKGISGDSGNYIVGKLLDLNNDSASASFGNDFQNVAADFTVKVENFKNSSDPIRLSSTISNNSIHDLSQLNVQSTGKASYREVDNGNPYEHHFEFILSPDSGVEMSYHTHFGCSDCIESHSWNIELNGSKNAYVSYRFAVTNISSYEKTSVNVFASVNAYILILPLALIPIIRRKVQTPQ